MIDRKSFIAPLDFPLNFLLNGLNCDSLRSSCDFRKIKPSQIWPGLAWLGLELVIKNYNIINNTGKRYRKVGEFDAIVSAWLNWHSLFLFSSDKVRQL
jgi:hypothetical protein